MPAEHQTRRRPAPRRRLLGDEGPVAGGVQDARHPDDPLAREAAGLHRDVAHGVQRVGDDDQDGVRRMLDDLLRYAGDDVLVGLEQVVAAHPRLAGAAAGDDDDVRVGGTLRSRSCPFTTESKPMYRAALQHVERLALGETLYDVYEDHVGVVALREPLGRRAPDVARAYDRNLALRHSESHLLYLCALRNCLRAL